MTHKQGITPIIPEEWESARVELVRILLDINRGLAKAVLDDGSEPMDAPLILMTYTVATRPAASSWPGGIIFVSDGAAGQKFQGSDGTAWVNLG